MKKMTVTIGIPAYNEEKNVQFLLINLLEQKQVGYLLENIIVISDGSTDKTVSQAKLIKSNVIQVIDNRIRKGKAYRQNQLSTLSDTDILVILDADCLPGNDTFIEELTKPITKEDFDVTSCKKIPLPAITSVEDTINYSVIIKNSLFERISNKNNVYLCNGEAIAIRKKMYKKIFWPNTAGVDAYTYLYAKKNNFSFKYVKNTNVLYRSPQYINEHIPQSQRFDNSKKRMKYFFGKDFVRNEYSINIILLALVLVKYFAKNPILFTKFLIYNLMAKKPLISSKYLNSNTHLWSIAKSSKVLFNSEPEN